MANSGFVGFLDILGYQNIIENNEIEKVSRIISDILIKMPDIVRNEMTKPFSAEYQGSIHSVIDEIQFRLISDSLILAIKIDESHTRDPVRTNLRSVLFLDYVTILSRILFESGLPVRGVVDFGDFFLLDHCFAGIPLINCYKLSTKLQLSGVILTHNAREKFSFFFQDEQTLYKYYGDDYLIQLHENREEKFFLIDYWGRLPRTDIRQYVFAAFHDHNKDVSQAVFHKIVNTEFAIRHMLMMARKIAITQAKEDYAAGELTTQ